MRKGFSLALTLWIVVALMTGALFFVENGKKNLKINASILEKLELDLNADSYMNLLMFYLVTGSNNDNMGAIVKNNLQVPFLSETVPIDGTSFIINDFNVSVQSVSSMINLAYPDTSMIAKLFSPYSKEPEGVLQDSLQDWLDDDSLHRINGVEADYYASLGVLYEPRNKNIILSPEELRLIKGFNTIDEKIFNALKHYFYYAPYGQLAPYLMDEKLLVAKYLLDDYSLQQLMQVKPKGINEFNILFLQSPKQNFDPETQYTHISKVYKIEISSREHFSKSSRCAIVALRTTDQKAFHIVSSCD